MSMVTNTRFPMTSTSTGWAPEINKFMSRQDSKRDASPPMLEGPRLQRSYYGLPMTLAYACRALERSKRLLT